MKYAMIPAIIFSMLSLAACGGGGGGGEDNNTGGGSPATGNGNPNTNTPPKLASTSQIIDYYGDSTIWGWDGNSGGAEVQVQTPAPQIFAAALPATPPQTVNNLGKNGQTACQLLLGPDASSPNPTNGKNWDTLMTESNATVVILNHGINDFNATDTNARETVAEYGNCLTNLAAIAKNKGKFVIFETPNPIATPGLDPYVQSMKTIAAQQGIPVIDQYANLTQLIGGNDLSQFMPDGTHPNQSVYRIKGEFAASEFLKIEK